MLDRDRLEAAYQAALAALMKERHPDGYWVGELSTSALSTATAVMALHLVQKAHGDRRHQTLIDGGLTWLCRHQNADGGWGDTVKSLSNISTTMLCRAAMYMTTPRLALAVEHRLRDAPGVASQEPSQSENGCVVDSAARALNEERAVAAGRAEAWLFSRYGSTPKELAEAVRRRYGKDRTFATPILTTCALAGLVDWKEVPPLPFELAVFPQSWFRFLRLHVVSYALPALIAIGHCIYYHRKPWNPFSLVFRWLSRRRSLRVLERIQPSNGGFLEATPLTSFVCLSLAASGNARHPVAEKGIDFIVKSVRPDGSWPIDTNLSTWVTTLAVNALAGAGELDGLTKKLSLEIWLFQLQMKDRHPYTGAAPGGWGWTWLPGSVPDADDTAGALLALSNLGPQASDAQLGEWVQEHRLRKFGLRDIFMVSGLGWLEDLQNSDGGWPTFCRGWGRLPFDRSGADLTAHALRSLHFDAPSTMRDPAAFDALRYLSRSQRSDGSWLPLWFGNQHAPDDENPVYGTSRVLAAYRDLGMMEANEARRGVAFLLAAQNADGGWGGARGCPSSIEETSLAVEVLLDAGGDARPAVQRGLSWLIERIEQGGLHDPTPIGFYFARLWYYEKLYPIIFAVAALGRARRRSAISV